MTSSFEDQLAIQNLLYRYAHAADTRDVEAFAACFMNGKAWIIGPGFEMRDALEIIQSLVEKFEWTMHAVHNYAYEVVDDSAVGYTYCVATHVGTEHGQRIKMDWYIYYEDQLTKNNGGWVFVKRKLNVGLIDTTVLANQ